MSVRREIARACGLILVSALLSLVWGKSAIAQGAAPRAQRSVELQWETSPEAVAYIVEIRHYSGRPLKTFESKRPLLKFRAPVGDYEIRARVRTENRQLGKWSDWIRLIVPPKEVAFLKPNASGEASPIRTVVASRATGKAEVELIWTAEPTAQEYEVKIYAADGTVVETIKTPTPSLRVALGEGKFRYSVRSLAGGEFRSEEARAPELLVVSLPPPEEIDFAPVAGPAGAARIPVFSWSAKPGVAYQHKLERIPFLGEDWQEISAGSVTHAPGETQITWEPRALVPGRYRLTLWAEGQGFKTSSLRTFEFVVKPTEAAMAEVERQLEQGIGDD